MRFSPTHPIFSPPAVGRLACLTPQGDAVGGVRQAKRPTAGGDDAGPPPGLAGTFWLTGSPAAGRFFRTGRDADAAPV